MTLLGGSNLERKSTVQSVRPYRLLLDGLSPEIPSPSMHKVPGCLSHCLIADWPSHVVGSKPAAFFLQSTLLLFVRRKAFTANVALCISWTYDRLAV